MDEQELRDRGAAMALSNATDVRPRCLDVRTRQVTTDKFAAVDFTLAHTGGHISAGQSKIRSVMHECERELFIALKKAHHELRVIALEDWACQKK